MINWNLSEYVFNVIDNIPFIISSCIIGGTFLGAIVSIVYMGIHSIYKIFMKGGK